MVIINGKEIEFVAEQNIEVITKKIKEINGDDVLSKVTFNDDTYIEIQGLFVALGTASSGDLARKLGAEVSNHKIIVNDKMQTNIPGVYACGDCLDGMLQIVKAVYQGAEAAMSAIKYLKTTK